MSEILYVHSTEMHLPCTQFLNCTNVFSFSHGKSIFLTLLLTCRHLSPRFLFTFDFKAIFVLWIIWPPDCKNCLLNSSHITQNTHFFTCSCQRIREFWQFLASVTFSFLLVPVLITFHWSSVDDKVGCAYIHYHESRLCFFTLCRPIFGCYQPHLVHFHLTSSLWTSKMRNYPLEVNHYFFHSILWVADVRWTSTNWLRRAKNCSKSGCLGPTLLAFQATVEKFLWELGSFDETNKSTGFHKAHKPLDFCSSFQADLKIFAMGLRSDTT